jgi:hypothetical protein
MTPSISAILMLVAILFYLPHMEYEGLGLGLGVEDVLWGHLWTKCFEFGDNIC